VLWSCASSYCALPPSCAFSLYDGGAQTAFVGVHAVLTLYRHRPAARIPGSLAPSAGFLWEERKKRIHNFNLKMEKIERNQQQGEVMTGDWRR
jgi:hypothetical protein